MLLYTINFTYKAHLEKMGRIVIIATKNPLTIKSKELFVRVLLYVLQSSMLHKSYLSKMNDSNYVKQTKKKIITMLNVKKSL